MRFIRPSGFQVAELCRRSAFLAALHAESNAATADGHEVDEQVTRALHHPEHMLVLQEGEEARQESLAILSWVADTFPPDAGWEYLVQYRVELRDPWTGELLTAGTPDFMALHRRRRFLCVVDWKSIGQWYAGHLAAPGENMQQLIYCVAAMLSLPRILGCEIDHGQITLACWDDDGVHPQVSDPIKMDRAWEVIERVKAVPPVDPKEEQPEAHLGRHCRHCYERSHCSAYLLPPDGIPKPLEPMTVPSDGLSPEQALVAMEWLEVADEAIARATALRDIVRGNLEAHAIQKGAIVRDSKQWGVALTNPKRRGPTVSECEAMGREDLIVKGKPGVTFRWQPLGTPRPSLEGARMWKGGREGQPEGRRRRIDRSGVEPSKKPAARLVAHNKQEK